MGKNDDKKGVVELWGHKFKKAKDGLDEEQVVSFVNKLMKEHETLTKRAEHISSLTQLAEKTIADADDVAKQVQNEASERAKAEANAIIAKAEKQAQQLVKEKSAEVVATANREAEAIKAKAEQKAQSLLEKEAKSIQPELRDTAKRLYGELLTQLESLKQKVVALEEEFDHKLSQHLGDTSKVSMEADSAVDKFLELIQTPYETSEGEPEWEVEVLPPIDMKQILDIINHLDSLAKVEKTELISKIDKPLITVFVREPIDLIDILRALPQVAQVTEDTTESADAEGKPRKLQIELSAKTVPQESR